MQAEGKNKNISKILMILKKHKNNRKSENKLSSLNRSIQLGLSRKKTEA